MLHLPATHPEGHALRRLIRILAALFALFLLGAAVLLVPPHLQTRRIAPALPATEELLALGDAPAGPVGIEFLTVAGQHLPGGALAHTVVLLRWADGRTFMIDAAMDREGAADFAALLRRIGGAGGARFFGDVAEQLGSGVRDVRGVGFTHLHIDHVQGLGAFCAARGPGAAVFQTRWQAEQHNFNTRESAALVRDSCLEEKRLEGEGVLAVEGFPGLGAVALGGHTPGSTLWAAAVDGHLWLFSGDTTNTKADLRNDVGKGFLYSGILVPENTARTGELRRWLAGLDARDDVTVVVSHDGEDAARNGLPRYRDPVDGYARSAALPQRALPGDSR